MILSTLLLRLRVNWLPREGVLGEELLRTSILVGCMVVQVLCSRVLPDSGIATAALRAVRAPVMRTRLLERNMMIFDF